jgi:prepilin-type N-terminal cleavage/methylation domain-containing protein
MPKYKQGFTLLEVLLAIFIFSAVAAGVAAFSAYYLKNYSYSFEETQSIGLAQNGLTTIIREIREARMGEDGSWPIVQADDFNFIFYSDVTNDGKSDKVRYFLNGSTLQKGVIQPTDVPVTYPMANEKIYVVSSNIDTSGGPIFSYYNGNWPADVINNPLSSANRILNTKFVKIYLKINMNQNFGAKPFELRSAVAIRSMKDNL